jgi:hypothetical protein
MAHFDEGGLGTAHGVAGATDLHLQGATQRGFAEHSGWCIGQEAKGFEAASDGAVAENATNDKGIARAKLIKSYACGHDAVFRLLFDMPTNLSG